MILQSINFGGGRLQFLNPKDGPYSKRVSISPYSSSVRCVSELAGNAVPVHEIGGILHNKVIVSATVCAAIGQLIKPFASTILYGKEFDLKTCVQAGGFPSTHSSSVVATATCLAVERGFSDALFGLAVVYAGLVMYDAQGVRREVGTHAKVLNKVIPNSTSYSPSATNDANDMVNCYSRESSTDLETSDPTFSGEHSSSTSSLLLKSENRVHIRSDINGTPAYLLKESIGHTEVEVAAGALLGLVVSLLICPYI